MELGIIAVVREIDFLQKPRQCRNADSAEILERVVGR